MLLTPKQLKICKALFKPLVWSSLGGEDLCRFDDILEYAIDERSNYFTAYLITGRGRVEISENTTCNNAKAAAEQHYYETMAENVNWEKKINVTD